MLDALHRAWPRLRAALAAQGPDAGGAPGASGSPLRSGLTVHGRGSGTRPALPAAVRAPHSGAGDASAAGGGNGAGNGGASRTDGGTATLARSADLPPTTGGAPGLARLDPAAGPSAGLAAGRATVSPAGPVRGPAGGAASGRAGDGSALTGAVGPCAAPSLAALRAALAQADWTLASLPGDGVGASDSLDSLAALLRGVPAEVRVAYRERLLGPLTAHDRVNSVSLLETLAVFLELDGSWSRAARALHVHVNTVHYRVRRIEELTGRDLARLEDRADLRAALLCEPLFN